MPHSMKGIVDELHDLGRRLCPSQFEKFLPHMASVTMDDCLGNTAQKLAHHNSLVVLWYRVKRLLNNVATKRIHRKVEGVSTDGLCNLDDLLWCSMLEAALN